MKQRVIRFLSAALCLLVLAMPLTAVHAESAFCPALFQWMERFTAGETLAVTLSGKINKLLPFESAELAIVNAAMADAALTLTVAADQSGAFSLTRGGEEAFSFAYREDILAVNGETMLLGPVGQEQLIPQSQADYWECLKAVAAALPQLEAAIALQVPARTASGTVISNLGSVREGRAYTLPQETVQQLLPQIAALLPDAPGMELVRDSLALCDAAGEISVTFYPDSHGTTVCCEASGPLLIRQAAHNFRMMIAMNSTGINCSLVASAVEGKGLTRIGLKAKVSDGGASQKDLSGSFEVTLRSEEGKYSLTGEAVLSSRTRAEGDTLTGRLTWTETDGSNERSYALRPDLLISADQASGTVAFTQKKGETLLFSTDLNVTLTSAQPVLQDVPRPARVDAYASEHIEDILLTAFAKQMAALDTKDMLLLTHALRSEAWMESTTDLLKVYSIFDFQVEE